MPYSVSAISLPSSSTSTLLECSCVLICVLICACVCEGVHANRGQRRLLSFLLYHSPPYSFVTESLTEPGARLVPIKA